MDLSFAIEPLYWGWLAILGVVSFFQNMAFTWVSRSRNSGDPRYHRYAAWCSNGIWLLCYLMVWHKVWGAFEKANYIELVPMFLVYIVATTEGSVFMMKILLKREKGKKQVGAQAQDELKVRIVALEETVAKLTILAI